MNKKYESPEVEIENFSITSTVATTLSRIGWGDGGEEGEF
jgi:hypothetical protein